MKSKRRAFTLIELIVVVAIIMLLVTILAVSLRTPKGQANNVVCLNNLRDIGTAALAYANQHNSYPAGWVDANTRWMDLIEDHIEKESNVYRCPTDLQQLAVTGDPDGMILSYGINRFSFGAAASSFWNGVKIHHVNRPSQTILFADCTPGLFYCGDPAGVFPDPVPDDYQVLDVDYRHVNDSFCVAFADGHAEVLTATTQEQWDASQ
jgi:type II secretory pathway pseudopilin PulG